MKYSSRRAQAAAETRQLLVQEAARLFSRQGFAATSLEEIGVAAGVTKGALYHHFSSKEDLYAECYEQQAARVAETVASTPLSGDPWQDALAQCRAFLGCAYLLDFHAVSIQEAITVLGWQRWRELDAAYTMSVLKESLERLHRAGRLGRYDRKLLADAVYALLVNAMMALVTAEDKKRAEKQLLRQLEALLSGVLRN